MSYDGSLITAESRRRRRAPAPKSALVVLVLFAVLAVTTPTVCQENAGRAARITREDLAAAVEANRSRIGDFSVFLSYTTTPESSPNIVSYDEMRIAVKGDRTYCRSTYASRSQRAEGKLFQREVAFNGEISIVHEPRRAKAMLLASRENETQVWNFPITRFMRYTGKPVGPKQKGEPMSFASYIGNIGVRMRDQMEEVNGQWCYVTDRPGPEGWSMETIWISPDKGFLPVKIVMYYGEDPSSVWMEQYADDAVELEAGLWFPTRGRHIVRPQNPGELPWEYEYEVLRGEDGELDIAVNTGIEDDFFDLWKRLPPGTAVYDQLGDVGYTVGGEDYHGIADQLETVPEFSSLPVPERSSARANSTNGEMPQAPEPPDVVPGTEGPFSNALVLGIVVLLVAVAVTVVLASRRRRHGKEGPE